MVETVRLSANLFVEVHDAVTGQLRERQAIHNLVVDAGLDLIVALLAGSGTGITHFAVGTSSTAAAAGQTALVAETFRGQVTQRITSVSKQLTVKYFLPSGSGNGATLAEAGLFNAASSGTMFARALLSSTIAKDNTITVTFTWEINLAAS